MTKKTICNLPLNEAELSHVEWALSMDVDMSADHLAEKRALLDRIKKLKPTEQAPKERKRKTLPHADLPFPIAEDGGRRTPRENDDHD